MSGSSQSLRRLSRLALGVGAMLMLLSLLALAALAWASREDTLASARERGELIVQVLEADASRSIESAALTLRALGEALPRENSPAALQSLLAQSLVGQPFLRGVAVLDEQGRVLGSSQPADLGRQLSLAALGRLPAPGADQLMDWQPGRGLADLALRPNRATASRSRVAVGMLPLLMRLGQTERGGAVWLLALINPDALANFQQRALPSEDSGAWLAGFRKQLIAATDRVPTEPGQRLEEHPVFAQLAQHERGSYEGTGTLPGRLLVSYRSARSRALVVALEQREDELLLPWQEQMRWLVAAGAALLLLIGGATAVVRRSLAARVRAAQALEQAHERVALREREMSVLLKSVQELIFRTDEQGRISFVNARWAAVSPQGGAVPSPAPPWRADQPPDQAPEQGLGGRLSELVEGIDRERVEALFDARDGEGVRSTEAALRAHDGSLRRFAITVVPLLNQGRIAGFAGSAMDITERHVAQRRLQQQLSFTELLLEISPLPISMMDTAGRYVTVNRAWEELTGRARDGVIGQPVGFFLPAAERALHSSEDRQLLERGGRISYETQILHQDGTLRDMRVTKVVVDGSDGRQAGILCTLMDVSEFRAAERATRQARDAAEEASRAKTEFIANISHELRTPLQSILGFSELGMARAREHARLAAMFTDIHASGQRMLALVNDLLDVAKIESPVGHFDLERCDLRQPLQEVLQELAPLTAKKRLRLELLLPQEPLQSKVDPLRIQQVMRNVLANAIKFSPEGALLRVEGSVVQPGELGGHGDVLLRVADRGPGIPEAELERIFEAFVQSSATKDGSGGTGLGLAICRKIIEVHGGRIRARNREGGGSVFEIVLPWRSPEAAPSGLVEL